MEIIKVHGDDGDFVEVPLCPRLKSHMGECGRLRLLTSADASLPRPHLELSGTRLRSLGNGKTLYSCGGYLLRMSSSEEFVRAWVASV